MTAMGTIQLYGILNKNFRVGPREIMIGECPKEISGAKVIAYAIVRSENAHTENTKQIVAGETKGAATAMIIAQYENDSSYYVFGCYSQEWTTQTDTWHEDLDDAVEQLDWEYENLSKNIVWYMKPDLGTQ